MTTEKSKSQPKEKCEEKRALKQLDTETAAMLESQEVKAITGEGEDWWCPNPDCEIVDK